MKFSRFYKASFFFFLFCPLVIIARSTGFKDNTFNKGQPLFFEIPNVPHSGVLYNTSLLVDKGNRLFISTEQELYIYDGINYQQIDTPNKPIMAFDGNDRIAIAGDNYLSLLTLDESGKYSINRIIDSSTLGFHHQIIGVGFEKESIFFSVGTKLFSYQEKLVTIDSSTQVINLFRTRIGLVFHTSERGFYKIEGKSIISLSNSNTSSSNVLKIVAHEDDLFAITTSFPWFYNITDNNSLPKDALSKYLNLGETILNVTIAGSYFFVTTSSNCLLMFDKDWQMVNRYEVFGNSQSTTPIDIGSSDDINFFAITSSQIFRFINPCMIQLFDYRVNLRGQIKDLKKISNQLYAVTTFGLYALKESELGINVELLKQGDFNQLTQYHGQLFAIGGSGLYILKNKQVDKITKESSIFQKTVFTEPNTPQAIISNWQGISVANLSPPFLLQKIQNINPFTFTNFYTIDNLLLLKNSNNLWYQYKLDCKSQKDQYCFVSSLSKAKNDLFIIDLDTLAILKDRLVKIEQGIMRARVGKTFSQQPIINLYSAFHPNYQTFIIENGDSAMSLSKPINFFALEDTYEVNSTFLDADSSGWVSTSQGLIKISPDLIKHSFRLAPRLNVYSLSSVNGDSEHSIYDGFVLVDNNFSSEDRIKQGNSIAVRMSGLGNYSWNNLTFSFKLDRSRQSWSKWSTNSKYVIQNLKPGFYTLKVKTRDVFGLESPEFSLTFKIIPNFFQTKFTLFALLILTLISFFTFYRWRSFNHALERFKLESIINRRTEELVKEKEKTDNLLARVLPKETATELKETGKVNTQRFNIVTVLFSDIQGFTKITDELNPENLIDQLDKFFLYFDSVVEKYRIEKIKTIGDAYMCAGGIPHKNRTNPVEVVLAALEMMYFMREINLEHNPGQDLWDLRIGIDTGPVIAGVVGRSKLSYDIWGTTVNTASRMESSGEVGKINISGNTHLLVQEYFLCTYRGKMPIKNKGDIEMYFVNGIKPALSTNLDGFRPNSEFLIRLQLLRFGDLEELILDKLDKGLPKNLYYHNLKHTVDVYTQVELIGRSENVIQEDQLLLQTAALFHDAGHLIDYDTHEEMGVKLAREILPEYLYNERQIEIISNLIMITKLPPQPKNLMEAIMCDADLDYLGRTDFIPVSNMLYKELHEHGKIGTIQEWNEIQIKFIEKHQYFTNTARKLRNVNKNSQLENIKKWIEKNKL